MVDFKTRIYTESDNDIIGAEVFVYSDNGDEIGSIEIANAEDLEDLRSQLAVIDSTYFTESRLNTILANANESTTINATTISGFASSDLAKVSQLSNYAAATHTHVKSAINDLYNYNITCSNYNPTIDTDISVTVKVTNQAGTAVTGQTVNILKNNSAWRNGVTDSNGEFTTTYTCSEWGLTTFSANNKSIQVCVDGWRLLSGYTEQSSFRFYRNKTHAKMILEGWGQTITFTSTWTQFGSESYATTIKPKGYVVGINNWGNVFFRINPNGVIYHRAISSNVSNTNNWMQLEWAIDD